MELNKETIDCLFDLSSENDKKIDYFEKYKIIKKKNLVINQNKLDKIIEIEKYIDNNLNQNKYIVIALINELIEDNYIKHLKLDNRIRQYLDIIIKGKEPLNCETTTIMKNCDKTQLIDYLKNSNNYLIMKGIKFNDVFFNFFKNIETCLIILKDYTITKDIKPILDSQIKTIRNLLFYKNIFYMSYYYDIKKNIYKIDKLEFIKLLSGEIYNILNNQKNSNNLLKLHSFFISETEQTIENFKNNLKNVYKNYKNEIDILNREYNIDLKKIIQKYTLQNINNILLFIGLLQNIYKFIQGIKQFA